MQDVNTWPMSILDKAHKKGPNDAIVAPSCP